MYNIGAHDNHKLLSYITIMNHCDTIITLLILLHITNFYCHIDAYKLINS